MNKQRTSIRFSLIAAVLAIAVAGCGGGGHAGALPSLSPTNGSGTQSSTKPQLSSVVFTIPAASRSTSSKDRKTLALVPGGNAICATVQNLDPATSGIYGSGYAGAGFTVCQAYTYSASTPQTITIPAPPGNDVFTIGEYIIPAATTLPYTSSSNSSLTTIGAQPLTVTSVPSLGGPNSNTLTFTGPIAASVSNAPVTLTASAALSPNVVVGSRFNLDSGSANQEFITVLSVPTANTITAVVANAHAGATVPATGVVFLPSGQTVNVNALLDPTVTPAPPITLFSSPAGVYLGGSGTSPVPLASPVPLPITNPLREQGAFVGTSQVGVPIPVVGIDNAGNVIPGNIALGYGAFPKSGDSLTLSSSETGPGGASTTHAKLYLLDAVRGTVVQTEVPGTTPITLTQFNQLDAADAGVANPLSVGNPYVVVLGEDASAGTQVTSITVTLSGTFNGTALTPQKTVIAPQSSIFTASTSVANGYVDAAAPYTSASDILCTIASCLPGATPPAAGGQAFWVSDKTTIASVGGAHYVVTNAAGTAATLTGMTYDDNTNVTAIAAVDNGAAGGAPTLVPQLSGLWLFNPVTHASLAVAAQNQTTGNYIQFKNPQGVGWIENGFLYVAANNTITAVDPAPGTIGGGYAQGEAYTVSISGLSPALNFSGTGAPTGIGIVSTSTSSGLGKLYIADYNNSRIAIVDFTGTGSQLVGTGSSIALGDKPVGLTVSGTSLLVTAASGQIYTIANFASTPGTPVPLLLAANLGASVDGGIGEIPATGGTTTAAQPYAVQGQTTNFFGSASVPTQPYSLAPFPNTTTGPVLSAAAQAAALVAPFLFAPDSSNTKISATAAGQVKAPFGIVPVSAANATNAALTKDSYLITDSGTVRTIVP